MTYNQELQNKKEKAQALLAEYLVIQKNDYLNIVIEALQDYIDNIDNQLKQEI
jgi:hypothetical protein